MMVLLIFIIVLEIALIFLVSRMRRLEDDLYWWKKEAQRLNTKLRK